MVERKCKAKSFSPHPEPDEKPGEAESQPLSLVPRHPGEAPFVNLVAIFENSSGYLAEAKREIQCSAVRCRVSSKTNG